MEKMKTFPWSFASNVMHTNCMTPCSPEDFSRILDDNATASVCEDIIKVRARWQAGEITAEEFERRKSELKRRLPVFCFHATFRDGHRSNGSAVPSGLSILDLDHLELAPQEFYFQQVAGREQELGICLAHVSPSGEGLRLVFRMGACETLELAQRRMAEAIGCKAFDACVKDLARCSFAVPRAYLIYIDEEALFAPSLSQADEEAAQADEEAAQAQADSCKAAHSLLQTPSQPAAEADTKGRGGDDKSTSEAAQKDVYEAEYEGIPYETVLHALEEQLGGIPVHGSRNNFIYAMACALRYICNDDEQWIQQVLPNYGEAEERWRTTIHSAVNRAQTLTKPAVLQRALDVARKRHQAEQYRIESGVEQAVPPTLPTSLPRSLRLLTSKVPDHLKPAVAMGVFPSIATHLHGVRFRYNDNSELEPTFQVVLVAKMSSGKSCVNKPIDAIMADIKERDAEARAAEQEWKNECAAASANTQKPTRPEGLCVQWVQPDMTNAALVQKLADACGRPIYSRMDEIELLNNLRTNGRGDQVSQILRLAWDAAEYGQERVGVQSVTATVNMRWNFNASTTPQKCRRFFREGIMNGTVSRVTFSTIYTDNDRLPVYGSYDDRFQQLVNPYIQRATDASGLIVCRRANQLIDEILEENSTYADLSGDDAWRELSYRATVAAFKRAMVLYIVEGNRWSKEIEEFVRWSFHYDMWCKMWLFGKDMRHQMELENSQPTGGVGNLLNSLPHSFVEEDLRIVRAAQGMTSDPTEQLRNWKRRGYVTYDAATRLYAKTEFYLDSPQATKNVA
jgi:hypothetical protein